MNFIKFNRKRKSKFPVELKGSNWMEKKDLPIAIFFNFNPWKRDLFARFLTEYRCAFVVGKKLYSFLDMHNFLNKIKKDNKIIIVNWGEKSLPVSVNFFLKLNPFVKVLSIEDGFLRSLEVGVLHTRPSSICIDEEGAHFNAHKKSNIESLLNNFDFSDKQGLIERAENSIKLFKDTGLSKYYDGLSFLKNDTFQKNDRYIILVVGQVEDDASIVYGSFKIKTNLDLIKRARKDFPKAEIYYRPHPDYVHGNRKNISKILNIKELAIILDAEIPLNEVLNKVDHVYTITSLVGFEALIYGKKVTTCGVPFYSNWGLTEDKEKIRRRKKKRTLEELFAIAYLEYPNYFHLTSDENVSFEDTAFYFLFEVIKGGEIFELDKNKIFNAVVENNSYYYTPIEVLKYLVNTKFPTEGDTSMILKIIEKQFYLRDYPQISHILVATANYDALVKYSNYCLNDIKDNIAKYLNNTMLLDSFFYSLSLSQKDSNGRVIEKIPDFIDDLLLISRDDKYFLSIMKNYIACCSNNLQYNVIAKFISKLSDQNNLQVFDNFWSFEDYIKNSFKKIINNNINYILLKVLSAKPSRSERNINKRKQLIGVLSKNYLNLLNENSSTIYDSYLNKCLYHVALDEIIELERELNRYLDLLSQGKVVDFIVSCNRLKDFLDVTNYLIKKKRVKTVQRFIEQIKSIDYLKDMMPVHFTMLSYYKVINELDEFYALLDSLPTSVKKSDKIITLKARILREEEFFGDSLVLYKKLYVSAKTIARKVALKNEIDRINFIIESSYILNSVPQPKFPKGVVFISSQTCFNSLAMMIPSYVELKRKGYAVINLIKGMTVEDATNFDFIDKFHGKIPLNLTNSGTIKDLSHTWEIDWRNKKVVSSKINFYQGFYERLSTLLRKYHVDISEYDAHKQFIGQLTRADTCLQACEEIYQEIVINRNLPVTFVSGNSHVTPYSVFRDFAMSKNNKNLGFVNCNVAYEAYFSNLGGKFSNTMCVTDMTLYPTIRAPFMARRDKFENWYEKNQSNSEFLKKADSLININRMGSSANDKELEIIEFLKIKKKEGKKILCAFGKIPVDLGVPFDGGPAHEDMADWLNHTVKICSNCEDVILLVKPHPHELRPEIALDLIGGFNELITEKITENIVLLGHKDVNGHALAQYLDLAILYNGSSALEMSSQGVPVVMASYFGMYDYPLDLIYPESRKEYKEFIQSLNYPIPCDEVRKKASFLMCYMGTEEISTLNQYSIRPLTNDKIGIPKWNQKKIKNLLEKGDDSMALIAEQIVEKFE
jgi:hypothetical protein